jgi:thioredoxin reductase (NADPH)
MESLYTYVIFFVLLGILGVPYWIRAARHRREAEEKFTKFAKGGALMPVTLHPHIDLSDCIGCASCVKVCPENVLGIVNGRARVIAGMKCVGHSLCAEVCPTGALTLSFGSPKQGMEIPHYDNNYQTNIDGLYIAGELGGIGLIKNAVAQSIKAIDHIAARKRSSLPLDVVIVGAGPAGMTAALACHSKNLRYTVFEQDSIGGTIFHYPRQKLVLTSPVVLPLHGTVKVSEISKEELLGMWQSIVAGFQLKILTGQKVELIESIPEGFRVKANGKEYLSGNVVLAVGRRGSPRKLGVPGEDLPKVAYQLIDAKAYHHKHLLVVGGGDSAVEAAIGLASQSTNTVTISYRRESFVRLKEKNEERINELITGGRVNVLFNSNITAIEPHNVLLSGADGKKMGLENDFVFIFAGGEPPTELLKKIGVKMREGETESRAA